MGRKAGTELASLLRIVRERSEWRELKRRRLMVNMSVSPHPVMESSNRSSWQELTRVVSGARYQSLWVREVSGELSIERLRARTGPVAR